MAYNPYYNYRPQRSNFMNWYKYAAQAPPMDPAMMGGGMPPMDPAMMGGGMPPMDPSMMGPPPMDPAMMGGGMPPMDPSMMGGGMPPMDPSMMGAPPIDPAQAGLPPAAPPPDDGMKKNKKQQNDEMMQKMQTSIYNIQVMMAAIMKQLGINISPEALILPPDADGPDIANPSPSLVDLGMDSPEEPPAGGEMPKTGSIRSMLFSDSIASMLQ